MLMSSAYIPPSAGAWSICGLVRRFSINKRSDTLPNTEYVCSTFKLRNSQDLVEYEVWFRARISTACALPLSDFLDNLTNPN
jgi:hypothetical protein